LHANDGLHLTTPYCGPFWPINATVAITTVPKWPTRPVPSIVTLLDHDGNFEPMVGIISSQIKSQDLTPLKIKCPSFIPYK